MFYWLMKSVVLGPVLRLLFRPTVEGAENIPETGGAILASNHLSFSDSIFLPLVLDRKVVFLAKADYFTTPGAKGKLTAMFFKLADQLPIDRSGGRGSDAALRTGMRVLNRGDLLGIYPEGTRSPDGRLYRGKTGVARMALEGLVPVLPGRHDRHGQGAADRPPDPQDRADRDQDRRAAGLQPVRGHGGRPVHPALDHRRDHVPADGALRARSTSTSTRRP